MKKEKRNLIIFTMLALVVGVVIGALISYPVVVGDAKFTLSDDVYAKHVEELQDFGEFANSLSSEQYDVFVKCSDFKANVFDDVCFREGLKNIGVDDAQIKYIENRPWYVNIIRGCSPCGKRCFNCYRCCNTAEWSAK